MDIVAMDIVAMDIVAILTGAESFTIICSLNNPLISVHNEYTYTGNSLSYSLVIKCDKLPRR